MVTLVKHIQFRLARWELPDGSTITEEVPQEYQGNHFGPELRKHIIYQAHQNRVPEEKIYQELIDKGIQISVGQIGSIITKATKEFAPEYNDILKAGLLTSKQINVDDTSDRHKGKNGYTTVVCNETFTYLKSTDSKSRINFLEILTMQENPTYTINQNAFEYARKRRLGEITQTWFESCENKSYTEQEFEEFLNSRTFSASVRRILEEACLYATCIESGLSPDIIISSDDAGQFNIMVHALCWIHAERPLKKLIAVNDEEATEIKRIRGLVWDYYAELLEYQKAPSAEKKAYLSERFDTIFSTQTTGFQLAPALKRFRDNKNELLVVLDHPDTPLHNNLAERDIRHTVIKRKISGGTRSTLGRMSRDVFVSLFKTCQKNGISIWNYLSDRIKKIRSIDDLGNIIRMRNSKADRARPSPQF
jgi:Transposase IS66 family